MLTYPWKCTVLHCNHLGNTWKPLVLMTRHFEYCPSASKGDNQSVRSSAPVVSRCFPGGYNVKLYISRGRLAWWLLAFFAPMSSSSLAQVTCTECWLCYMCCRWSGYDPLGRERHWIQQRFPLLHYHKAEELTLSARSGYQGETSSNTP